MALHDALPLNRTTLAHHAARVRVPAYDRTRLAPSVVHMSVGSFHRSHQAVAFDDLAALGHTEWGLVGVGLRRPEMRAALAAQDGLYTVLERGPAGDAARVVGVIGRYLFAPEDGEGVLATLADPRTRLVTLTITGGAYGVDPVSGLFDVTEADVAADLATPRRPRSAIGFLVEALGRRRRAGLAPFTVLSCDNLPRNGAITRTALASFAALRGDDALASWIEREVAFPSSMVDRITPRTTEEDRALLAERFGVVDRWPVVTEPFSQWVVEDAFSCGRPPLDEVGVEYVADVAPWSLCKTRLLNASHCALGALGLVAGHRRTDGAMEDPAFGEYAAGLMAEVAPLLPDVPGLDLDSYRDVLLGRLRNPAVGDRLARLVRNGSAKVPHHVVSSIRDARRLGMPHPHLTLAVAGWFRMLRGTDESGRPVFVEDPLGERLRTRARAGGSDPRPLLADRALFGDLGQDAGFVAELTAALETIDRDGVRAALDAIAAGPGMLPA